MTVIKVIAVQKDTGRTGVIIAKPHPFGEYSVELPAQTVAKSYVIVRDDGLKESHSFNAAIINPGPSSMTVRMKLMETVA